MCCVCVHLSRSVVSIGCALARAGRGIRLSSGFPPFLVTFKLRMNRKPIQPLRELKAIVVRCKDHKYLEVLGLLVF
jgi:hypothetical protein